MYGGGGGISSSVTDAVSRRQPLACNHISEVGMLAAEPIPRRAGNLGNRGRGE